MSVVRFPDGTVAVTLGDGTVLRGDQVPGRLMVRGTLEFSGEGWDGVPARFSLTFDPPGIRFVALVDFLDAVCHRDG